MSPYSILWADDEIDLLKPHILFLRSKGYDPVTVNNGRDALELVAARHFDLVILDENMPGLTGLETLQRIKEIAPQTPVIMITKSEEENIMDQAVGNNIADYLIKPVNPNQILLSIKKSPQRQTRIADSGCRLPAGFLPFVNANQRCTHNHRLLQCLRKTRKLGITPGIDRDQHG